MNAPRKIAVVGPSWIPVSAVTPALDRELRVYPNLMLVTQEHFVEKLQTWAREHKILIQCVLGPNRYEGNKALLASGAQEFLVFHRDRFTEHLMTLDPPLVRSYDYTMRVR